MPEGHEKELLARRPDGQARFLGCSCTVGNSSFGCSGFQLQSTRSTFKHSKQTNTGASI